MDLLEYKKNLVPSVQSGSSCDGFETGDQRHPCLGTPAPNSAYAERRETHKHHEQDPGRGALRTVQTWAREGPGHGQCRGVWAWPWWEWGLQAKDVGAQDSAHQLGGRCSGAAFFPRTGLRSKLSAVHVGGRGCWLTGIPCGCRTEVLIYLLAVSWGWCLLLHAACALPMLSTWCPISTEWSPSHPSGLPGSSARGIISHPPG